ncbi:hypothetical protein SAMN05443246_3986 [Paenibacillus sp. GP183]|nr:hypothetical protein SAMN05443246_3986 [Paenibacillus sp. GP183]
MVAFAIFLALLGLFNLFAPRAAWYGSIGWKLRDAEPSDAYLIILRIGGGIVCIVAIIIFLTAGTGDRETSTEKMIRDNLANNQIESVTLQMKPVTSIDADELKNWILKSNWKKPAIDYRKQSSFSSAAELDIHLNNGREIEVFKMGNDQIGIGEKVFYPEYVFSSPLLENWFSTHGY